MSAGSFHRAMAVADFPASGMASLSLKGWRVLLAREGDEYRALNDRCSHAASPLSGGRIRNGAVMCPLHGARYSLANGTCLGQAYRAVRTFPVRVVEDWIEVAVPNEPPDLSEASVYG
jgi:anthranilate 1,2-dioxygenase ferredoxin subunit